MSDVMFRLFNREIGNISNSGFQRATNTERLAKLNLSRHRDVKVVGHGAVTTVDMDPIESRYILAGSSDGLVAIYDTDNCSGTPKHVSLMVGSTSNNTASNASSTSMAMVQWYPTDNGLFVSSGADGQLKVWDANVLAQPVETFILSKRIYSHHLSPLRPSNAAVATDINHIRLVDLRSGSSTHELRGHNESVLVVKWSPTLEYILASGCRGGKTLLWDVRKAKNCLMSLDMGHIKSRSKKRPMESCISHQGSVNGLVFSQ
jgi:DNA excision repair protein ERCC-8